MTATDKYARLTLDQVRVSEGRQRSDLELDPDFLSSIKQRGILSPILCTPDGQLVAGGRRFAAAKHLGLTDVPVRFVADGLAPTELRVIELEENIRRAALPWRDECRAVAELHQLWGATRTGWTHEKSEEVIGHDIGRWLRVARELDNPRLAQATSFWAAWNICQRIDQRLADSVLEDISFAGEELASDIDQNALGEELVEANGDQSGTVEVASDGGGESEPPSGSPLARALPQGTKTSKPPPAPEDILHGDFISWANTYVGPRFNFIHCDFPYGKRVFAGEWGGKADSGFQYEDTPDVYWELVACLCRNLDRLMTSSAHLMFWLSSEVEMQHATIERFRELAPELIFQPRALVWLKSDNVGIVPDPKRGPRWITELALMASRGDRTLVKPLANAYAAPTARSLHPSTKPEPVLRHFFGMFCDNTTRMLDPTCGSGSSLRAAESLNAERVFGIERDEGYVSAARKALREFRTLRDFTK